MGKTDFGGFFIHTLDQKNRVFIPAEFRSKLGAEFVVCTPPGSSDCIIIYTLEEWDRYFENLRAVSDSGYARAFAERIASSSKRCAVPDKQGRITLCGGAPRKRGADSRSRQPRGDMESRSMG